LPPEGAIKPPQVFKYGSTAILPVAASSFEMIRKYKAENPIY